MCWLVENTENDKIWPLVTSGDLTFDLASLSSSLRITKKIKIKNAARSAAPLGTAWCRCQAACCTCHPCKSQWRKMEMPLDSCVRIGTFQSFRNHDDLEQRRWPGYIFKPINSLLECHQRSLEATDSFLSVTLDCKEIEHWGWLHCVCLIKTHQLICNMTYFGYYVTLTWGQILTLAFRGHIIYLSNCLDERKTMMLLPILYLY